MPIRSRNKVSAEFNMSSLTDIIFLLLIFFMVTSTQISPNGLQVTLPKSANQVTPNQRTSVSITPDLQFAIEKQIIPFEQLEDALKTKLQGEAEPTILLRVDKDVPTGETVKVMDIANRNKWKFVLATKP